MKHFYFFLLLLIPICSKSQYYKELYPRGVDNMKEGNYAIAIKNFTKALTDDKIPKNISNEINKKIEQCAEKMDELKNEAIQ